jgi:hypothetical protein
MSNAVLAAHGKEVGGPAGVVAALELQGSRHMVLDVDGGEGMDQEGADGGGGALGAVNTKIW